MKEVPSEVVYYSAADSPEEPLAGERVAVIGYGNLGRSVALNLRDAGAEVIVGNIWDDYRSAAAGDGFDVTDIEPAVSEATLVYLLIPDEVMAAVFESEVRPALEPGDAIAFASGYALAFGLVKPPEGIDVLLMAPRMLGEEVRRAYLEHEGFFSYLSVESDATGRALDRLLGLAATVGSLQKGAMRLSARQEALLDLFIEQSVGPYIGTALQIAFQLGVEAGLPEEAMVLEMYMSGEMARTFQTFAEAGLMRSASWHGAVAQYGGFLGTLEVDREGMARMFKAALDEIGSGRFAQRFQQEQADGYPTIKMIEQMTAGDDPMSQAEDRVRARLDQAAPAADR